jgi:hypothetical protein
VKFFYDQVWESVPVEWRDILCSLPNSELQKLPLGFTKVIIRNFFDLTAKKEEWPQTLKDFISDSFHLSMPRSCTVDNLMDSRYETEIPTVKDRHMLQRLSPKKVHEVSSNIFFS